MIEKSPLRAILFAGLLALAPAMLPPAAAQADEVVEKARAAGLIGEQADGYLGFAKASTDADLKSRVDQINIKRKAIYTDLAGKRGVSVNDVAGATACQLLVTRVGANGMFRDQAGQWRQRQGEAAVPLPTFCPQG